MTTRRKQQIAVNNAIRLRQDSDRLELLVRDGFNAAQVCYRHACLGRRSRPGTPLDLRRKLDAAISCLCRARNRVLLEQTDPIPA